MNQKLNILLTSIQNHGLNDEMTDYIYNSGTSEGLFSGESSSTEDKRNTVYAFIQTLKKLNE